MEYKHLVLVGLSVLSLSGIIACSKANNNAPQPIYNTATPYTPYQSCMGPHCAMNLPPGARIGFYAQTSNMDTYLQNAGSVYTLQSGYRDLLKVAMGTCDRAHSNIGLSNCDAFMSGFHDIVIQVDGSNPNNMMLTMRAYPQQGNAWVSGQLPSLSQFFLGMFGLYGGQNVSGVFNPLRLTMTINPINNSQGFELRANGPTYSYAYAQLIQVQIANGKLEDPALDFNLYYNGNIAASGKLVRCLTQTCGL